MKIINAVFRHLLPIFLLTVLFACDQPADDSVFPGNGFSGCEEQDEFTGTYPNPTVETPPDVGMTFVAGTMFPLKKYGYEQVEYFFGGKANAYTNTSEMKSDGKWDVAPAQSADYKTRMLIYRPTDMSRFNGTVVMEWYNVTGGVDTGAEWIMIHTELLRRGYIYVGISAQYVGVEGGDPARLSPIGITLNLKKISPRRYESLSHPGDSFSYDIFAQAAQAVRHPKGISPLGNVKFDRLIAMGESQSATRLLTFINAFGKKTDLFDGYFIHSRLGYLPNAKGASAPLSQDPQEAISAPEVVIFREDFNKPVMNVQTETDLFVLGAYACRQPDNDMFRLWEIAGAAHADVYTMSTGMIANGDKKQADIIITNKPNPVMQCADPVSSAPQHHFVTKAALDALNTWIKDGTKPPKAPRITLTASADAVAKDEFGNALGGIRSPYVDAPVAHFSGANSSSNEDVCFLFGSTEMLNDATLQALYPTHKDYVAAVSAAADDAVEKGFLLSEDAAIISRAAEASDIPPQP